MTQKVVILTGPTASGKSTLAFELVKKCNAEIINGDSVQIYRDFSIGSCKPREQELASVSHHLYSAIAPEEHFDAARFVALADQAIRKIASQNRLPLIVGGTGLYLRSLLCGLVPVEEISEETKQEIDQALSSLRQECETDEEYRERVHHWFSSVDPRMAERLHPSDLQRIRRAAEVICGTGRSLADLQDSHENKEKRYNALVVVLLPDREQLYAAIDARVDQLFEQGLVEEVVELRSRYSSSCQAFGAIGYRHVCEHLDGRYSFDEMVRLLKRDTRHFAKRQMTWWRNQPAKLAWRELGEINGRKPSISEQVAVRIEDFLDDSQELSNVGIAFFRVC